MSTSNGLTAHTTALPTFKSIHNQPDRNYSYAVSSNASSSRSTAGRSQPRSEPRSEDGSDTRKSPSLADKPSQQENAGVNLNVDGTIRRSKRSSGGFLLDTSPNSSRLSRSLLSQKSVKGKEKLDKQPLSVPKRRMQYDGHDSESSRRASPLSSEVRSSPLAHDYATGSRDHRNGMSGQLAGSSMGSYGSGSSRQNAPSYGFDTDPAQIVDMALRLNEGRRKQASARRNVSSATEGRRIVSTATSIPARPSPPRQLDHQIGSLRQPTKRKPFDTELITPQKRIRGVPEPAETSATVEEDPDIDEDTDGSVEGMQVSRATQNRVAKAKQYFELAYEHRRLLSHLPPLRKPDDDFDPSKPGYDSKAYNPLQYARNRKLRFRERKPIMAEDDGWHDIEKVRAWVDAVVNSHTETKHSPLECVRLPQLTLLDEDAQDAGDNSNTDARKAPQSGKPRRPRSDWVTHPGDQIADAFWTEQGLNKQKIYNRDNELIFPPGTKFHFSGWRNRTPVKVPEELKHSPSSPSSSPRPDRRQAVAAPPSLPTFESAHKDHSWARTRSKFTRALKKGSKRKKRDSHDIFDTSSESSDSSNSTEQGKEEKERGRHRRSKSRDRFDLADGDPHALPVQGSSDHANTSSPAVDASKHSSGRESMEHARLLRHLRRQSTSMSMPDEDSEKRKLFKRSKFLPSLKLDSEDKGRSSMEYDSTAPGTPIGHGFPSIAINLSPPDSRSASPTRKGKSSIFSSVKDKLQRDHIEAADFAKSGSSHQSSKRGSVAHGLDVPRNASRGPSPASRDTSPFTKHQDEAFVDESARFPAEHRESMVSKVSSRTTDSKATESGVHRSHRVRGMFKGGRIAELVGNEVSRVGEFIWKRDPPRGAVTDEGSVSGYESDSDELTDQDDPAKMPSRPERQPPNQHQSSNKAMSPVSAGAKPSPKEAPQYHIQGLPSFTSPFQRDRDNQEKLLGAESPGGTPQRSQAEGYDSDPVSTAARARRAAGKSPRLDRLAPPKLDIRSATPDGRRSSYDFGTALDLSRTRSASELYNSAISGRPNERSAGNKRGLTAQRRSTNDMSRNFSHEGRSSSRPPQNIRIHDFFRTRALLLASTIKATNIATYCDEFPKPQSSFLFSAFQTTGATGSEVNRHLPARRKEEHAIAARHLIAHLNKQSGEFNDHLSNFTETTTVNLHREIQILEDKTESSLFPRLQALSDQAGQLAQKLTTTSTLAVKGVNDDVAEAFRMKRRGPYRFGRLLGYKLMEWGVVGLLWLIWFVVTVIRIVLGTARAIWAVIAWLFWLR
ncbi:hypothetical protein PMZ80_004313 [Knufia obscura]|uniref:Uncharacterized protein n=2 Tax=Knufia TaxID=430999 RepID=A0AAN8E9L3_9EURO|nr:hypothetical protein PMZ80_004313 [Knufia obscura]KAK5949188.1 hypothetical protein OHC33_009729 [Knufia fluminis]